MPKFRVKAEVITYCYLDIDAKTAEEANEIASKTDGGDFITIEDEGGFDILEQDTRNLDDDEN